LGTWQFDGTWNWSQALYDGVSHGRYYHSWDVNTYHYDMGAPQATKEDLRITHHEDAGYEGLGQRTFGYEREVVSFTNRPDNAIIGTWHNDNAIQWSCSDHTGLCKGEVKLQEYVFVKDVDQTAQDADGNSYYPSAYGMDHNSNLNSDGKSLGYRNNAA
jgi:hypothetical protein